MAGPPGVPRADMLPLLQQGLSNRQIGQILHTDPRRVARVRRDLGLPDAVRPVTLTRDQAWAARTRPAGPDGQHLDWTGAYRERTFPTFVYRSAHLSARRVAFEIGHGREPVGRVLPGCDWPGCVAPACTTDQPMRTTTNRLYEQIFGSTS